MKKEKSKIGLYFLGIVILSYVITFFINSEKVYLSLLFFKDILISIIPIFIIIFILMVITNYYVKPKALAKYLGKNSGIKGWLIAISLGVLSSGPIYIWYPLLKDLQKHGTRTGLIATFLYNRAVKIPILPLLISYFGIIYSLVLLLVMVLISVIQGWTTEKIMEVIK